MSGGNGYACIDVATDGAAYGDACAGFYDEIYPRLPSAAVATLLELAAGGAVLDLGVGTGRAALPLARRGCEVWGIDVSPHMLARLQARAQGLTLYTQPGDIAAFSLPRRFGLITCLVDTLGLLTPDLQSRVFACAARHLEPGGRFLVESQTPERAHCEQTELVWPSTTGPRIYRTRVHLVPASTHQTMAAAVGLGLQVRWRDWQRRAWVPGDAQGIAVYG